MSKKLAIYFPGIGYHCDKPLLHFSRRVLSEAGYESICLAYEPETFLKGAGVTPEGVQKAYLQCEKNLKNVPFHEYKDVILVAKSVGTLLAGKLTEQFVTAGVLQSSVRGIFFTPIAQTFPYMKDRNIWAMSGTKDPIISVEKIRQLSDQYQVNVELFKDANHSLEVKGNPEESIRILGRIVAEMQNYIK